MSLGNVSFNLTHNVSDCNNSITHFHTNIDGSFAMCSKKVSDCPIHQTMEDGHASTNTSHCQNLYNHGTQSHDQYTTAQNQYMYKHNNYKTYTNKHKNVAHFDENQHEIIPP